MGEKMIQFLRNLFRGYLYWKWSKMAILEGRDITFTRMTKLNLKFGSTSNQIRLHNHTRIEGCIQCCGNGQIEIGEYSFCAAGCTIRCTNKIFIGSMCGFGKNVIISDNNTHPINPLDRAIMWKTPTGSYEKSWLNSDSASITIEDNCWVGENSRICKGVIIGTGAIVAANSVVTKDVPANTIVAGNPAKIVKTDIEKTDRYFI